MQPGIQETKATTEHLILILLLKISTTVQKALPEKNLESALTKNMRKKWRNEVNILVTRNAAVYDCLFTCIYNNKRELDGTISVWCSTSLFLLFVSFHQIFKSYFLQQINGIDENYRFFQLAATILGIATDLKAEKTRKIVDSPTSV